MDSNRIEDAAREVYGHAEESLGSLRGEGGPRTRGTLDRAASKNRSALGQARDTAFDLMDRGGGGVADLFDAAQNLMSRGGAGVRQRLSDRPLATLLAAAAIGWAIALVLRGSTRRG